MKATAGRPQIYSANAADWMLLGLALAWGFFVALNPWALHIGGRSTPLVYWHGTGTVRAKVGKAPLYLWFAPGRPGGFSSGGRREGKMVAARLQGRGWLCLAPDAVQVLELSGTMYGGYFSDADSLLDFRLLERRKPFAINPQSRGFFDVAGSWRGSQLVMNRPNEQGVPFKSGLLIDNAVVTLRWASYEEFESSCRGFLNDSPLAWTSLHTKVAAVIKRSWRRQFRSLRYARDLYGLVRASVRVVA